MSATPAAMALLMAASMNNSGSNQPTQTADFPEIGPPYNYIIVGVLSLLTLKYVLYVAYTKIKNTDG